MIDREGPNRHVTFCCDNCGEGEDARGMERGC